MVGALRWRLQSPSTTQRGAGMARDRGLAVLRRALRSRRVRRAGWGLPAVLAPLGFLLGLLDAGWAILLAAVVLVLVLVLVLSSRPGRNALRLIGIALRLLRPRLPTRQIRWGAAGAGGLVLLVLVVVGLPPRFTAQRTFDKPSEELKAQNDVRTTLLQALAGGVLLLGAYLTYRQLRVSREGQLTDRYTKAVDQLGSDHLDVRVGGIYALERIARDSPPDRATIEEVLTAYLRGHAP